MKTNCIDWDNFFKFCIPVNVPSIEQIKALTDQRRSSRTRDLGAGALKHEGTRTTPGSCRADPLGAGPCRQGQKLALHCAPHSVYRQRNNHTSRRPRASLKIAPTTANMISPEKTEVVSNRPVAWLMMKPIPRLDDMNSPITVPTSA